jgi:hypothetical protein
MDTVVISSCEFESKRGLLFKFTGIYYYSTYIFIIFLIIKSFRTSDMWHWKTRLDIFGDKEEMREY